MGNIFIFWKNVKYLLFLKKFAIMIFSTSLWQPDAEFCDQISHFHTNTNILKRIFWSFL